MAIRKEGPRSGDRKIVISRTIDAPRDVVFRAWTEPDRVSRWWGPKGFTSPINKIDLRVGGKYLTSMRSPDGHMFWSTGVYKEIVPNERLVLTDSFADEKGNIVPASYYGMTGEFPLESTIVITFEEHEGKTKMTMTYPDIKGIADEHRRNMMQGWNEQFDKLEADLSCGTDVKAEPGKPEIVITRTFDAPRDVVFRTFMDPKLIPEWWGPRGYTTMVDRMDVKQGGSFRYVQKDPKGKEFVFNGKYAEIVPEKRVVSTFIYETMGHGHEVTETVTFEEAGGSTMMVDRSLFGSVEARDELLSTGMSEGACDSINRFSDLIGSVRKRQK